MRLFPINKLFIVIAVISILIVFSCCLGGNNPNTSTENALVSNDKTPGDLDCNEISFKDLKDECYQRTAIYEMNQTKCHLIDNLEKNYFCMAVTSNNVSICEKITSINTINDCYLFIASENNDSTICNKIKFSGVKDLCIYTVSIRSNMTSLCDTIQDLDQRTGCYGSLLKNETLCKKIHSPTIKEACFNSITYTALP